MLNLIPGEIITRYLSAKSIRSGVKLLLLVGVAVIASFQASAVTLAWDLSTSTDVAGYRIYYGTSAGNYTEAVEVGNTNQATIESLEAGTVYYFAATAVTSSGLESPFSEEVAYTVPGAKSPKLRVKLNQQKQVAVEGSAAAGETYQLQVTQDFVNWTTVTTVTADASGAVQYVDPAATAPSRFYRLWKVTP
ncbi:MAG TPA: fibronectin type III domain-containing protein [Clostridia bacterium]|nr:fibronectin type III domain-containing protein [Clostridia bacterium]